MVLSILVKTGWECNIVFFSLLCSDHIPDEFNSVSTDKICGFSLRDIVIFILKIPWTHSFVGNQSHPLWRIKCFSLQILTKIAFTVNSESDLAVFDLALHDEDENVKAEAVISLPILVLCSGLRLSVQMCKKLE